MEIKKSIIFLIILAIGIRDIFTQNVDTINFILKDKNFEMFFRITENNLNSATVKNSLVFNYCLGGINSFSVPKMDLIELPIIQRSFYRKHRYKFHLIKSLPIRFRC